MATSTLPFKKDRPAKDVKDRSNTTKPTRSMTHPLQNPKPNGAKRRGVKQGEPFDPEELTRRLQAHLVEQKLRAERRRDARAAKTASTSTSKQPSEYHHVPKVAAAQFERTTTPDVKRQLNKLVQPAVKAHLESLAIDEQVSSQPLHSLKRSQAMDQAIIERDFLRTRNQFQWDHVMEEAAEVDVYRDVYKPPQRTFVNEFAHLKSKSVDMKKARPLSTGDILTSDDDALHASTSLTARVKPDMAERNNWAQREVEVDNRRVGKKEKEATPAVAAVKKKPSSWILLGRRSPKQDKETSEKTTGIVESSSSPPPDGSRRSGFLARFKRQPSS